MFGTHLWRLVAYRLIKVLGNALKLLGYGFHAVFPGKRFTLPASSGPLLPARARARVPRVLWQTNFTDRVTLPVYLNYLCNRLMSPCHAYRLMTDEAAADFVAAHFPAEIVASYRRLRIGAARADFWRVLILQKFGGVYMDIDAHSVWPLGWVVPRDSREFFVLSRAGRVTNYWMASCPDNPTLARIIQRIVANVDAGNIASVYDLTGPGMLATLFEPGELPAAPFRWVCDQGNFTNEYFQYRDRPAGKWTRQQEHMPLLSDPEEKA